MATLQDLLGEVTAQTTKVQSLKTLVDGLRSQLAALGVDQATLDQVFSTVKNTDAVLDAINANTTTTPAAPAPTTPASP